MVVLTPSHAKPFPPGMLHTAPFPSVEYTPSNTGPSPTQKHPCTKKHSPRLGHPHRHRRSCTLRHTLELLAQRHNHSLRTQASNPTHSHTQSRSHTRRQSPIPPTLLHFLQEATGNSRGYRKGGPGSYCCKPRAPLPPASVTLPGAQESA